MTIGVLGDDRKTEFAETKGAKIEPQQTVLPQPANQFFNSADDQEILPNDSKVPAISLPDQSESTFSLPLPITALSLPSTGVAPQGIAETVTATIVEMVKSGTNAPVELALSPEELGRLTISIRQEGDVVFVNLTADRPETLDLFRRHGSDLVADLRQAGFAGASLSFGQNGQGHPSRFASANPGPNGQQNLPPPPLEATPHLSAQARQGSGVDLRF
jgi:hypothetical protein